MLIIIHVINFYLRKLPYIAAKAAATAATGRTRWTKGLGAYKLGLVMGQHVKIIAIYRDTAIIARFRVQQLRVAVFVIAAATSLLQLLVAIARSFKFYVLL